MATIKQIKERLLTEALASTGEVTGKVIVTDMSFDTTSRWGVRIDYPSRASWYGEAAKSQRSALMRALHFFLAKNKENNPHHIIPNLTRKGNSVLSELVDVFKGTFHKKNQRTGHNDSERAFLEMVLKALLKHNPPDMKPTDLTKDDFEGRIRAQIDNIR